MCNVTSPRPKKHVTVSLQRKKDKKVSPSIKVETVKSSIVKSSIVKSSTRLPSRVRSNSTNSESSTNDSVVKHKDEHKSKKLVKHDYHDHSTDSEVTILQGKSMSRGGVSIPFPMKLYDMLNGIEKERKTHIVSWQPHGRCFVVHNQRLFVEDVMQKYFQQKKYASFQRQLNLYGFSRLTKGCDKGGYYHELFLRGKRFLASRIHRMKVKGTGARMASNPDAEPNFYLMAPAVDSPLDTIKSNHNIKHEYPPPYELEQVVSSNGYHKCKLEPQDERDDVLTFEGMPFHYLEPRKGDISSEIEKHPIEQTKLSKTTATPIICRSVDTIKIQSKVVSTRSNKNKKSVATVSDSDDDDDNSLAFLGELDKLAEIGNEGDDDHEFTEILGRLNI